MDTVVSVLMPAYNCERYIAIAIESILKQTFRDFELVICDDASTDATWEIINGFADNRIRKFKNNANQGALENYNFLLSKAEGTYITFQDNDDWSEESRLEEQVSIFTQYTDIALVACNGNFYYSDSITTKGLSFHSGFIGAEDEQNYILPAVLFKREVLTTVNGLHHYFAGAHSWDRYFVFNILSRFKGYAINRYLYTHRFTATSISRNLDNFRRATAYEAFLHLRSQRLSSGTDWLIDGADEKLMDYEKSLIRDRKFMAEKFRVFAVYQIDGGDLAKGFCLLLKSLRKNPVHARTYRTFLYGLRKLIQ